MVPTEFGGAFHKITIPYEDITQSFKAIRHWLIPASVGSDSQTYLWDIKRYQALSMINRSIAELSLDKSTGWQAPNPACPKPLTIQAPNDPRWAHGPAVPVAQQRPCGWTAGGKPSNLQWPHQVLKWWLIVGSTGWQSLMMVDNG